MAATIVVSWPDLGAATIPAGWTLNTSSGLNQTVPYGVNATTYPNATTELMLPAGPFGQIVNATAIGMPDGANTFAFEVPLPSSSDKIDFYANLENSSAYLLEISQYAGQITLTRSSGSSVQLGIISAFSALGLTLAVTMPITLVNGAYRIAPTIQRTSDGMYFTPNGWQAAAAPIFVGSDPNPLTAPGGLALGYALGQATPLSPITITSNSAASLTGLTITPANPTVIGSAGDQFTATATYADSSTANVTSQVAWATNLGTITASGGAFTAPVATNAAQHATITASLSGQTATTTVTIPALVLPTIGTITIATSGDGSSETISYPAITAGTYPVTAVSIYVGSATGQESTTAAQTNQGGGAGTFPHSTPSTGQNHYILKAFDAQGNSVPSPNEVVGTTATSGAGFTTAQQSQLTIIINQALSTIFSPATVAGINKLANPTLDVNLVTVGASAAVVAQMIADAGFTPQQITNLIGQAATAVVTPSLTQITQGLTTVQTTAQSAVTAAQSAATAVGSIGAGPTAEQIVALIPTLSFDGGLVLANPAPTTTGFSASGPNLNAAAGGYVGMTMRPQSGGLDGLSRPIATHTRSGAVHNFTFGTITPGSTTVNLTPFPSAPSAGVAASTGVVAVAADTFVIT